MQDKISRYNLIIEIIKKSKKPSFNDISMFLLKHDFPISHRTLQRDIEEIKYKLNISIEYDKPSNGYYIEAGEHSKKVVDLLQQKSFYSDLMEFIRENPSHREAIILDTDIYQHGYEFVQQILEAIRKQRRIEFEYQKFKDDKPKKYLIEPYAIKAFENRWYLVGPLYGKSTLYKFGVERIVGLKVTTAKFKRDRFIVPIEHFARMIGVNDEQRDREIIHLAFTALQAQYIETLPLHWTQKLLSKEKDWVVFEYYLIPNLELEQKILSFGTSVKVIKPVKLRNKMILLLQTSLKNYKN